MEWADKVCYFSIMISIVSLYDKYVCSRCGVKCYVIRSVTQEFNGKLKVVKVDCTEGNKQLMEKYKVYGLPCLIVFKDGEMVEGSFHEGAITRKGLEKYISDHVGLTTSV